MQTKPSLSSRGNILRNAQQEAESEGEKSTPSHIYTHRLKSSADIPSERERERESGREREGSKPVWVN